MQSRWFVRRDPLSPITPYKSMVGDIDDPQSQKIENSSDSESLSNNDSCSKSEDLTIVNNEPFTNPIVSGGKTVDERIEVESSFANLEAWNPWL